MNIKKHNTETGLFLHHDNGNATVWVPPGCIAGRAFYVGGYLEFDITIKKLYNMIPF